MRFCSKCYTCKNIFEFYKAKGIPENICKKCRNSIRKVYYDKNKKDWKNKHKEIKVCGYSNGIFIDKRKQYSKDRHQKIKIMAMDGDINNALLTKKPNSAMSKQLERYYQKKEEIIPKIVEYTRLKKEQDPVFKHKSYLRTYIVRYAKNKLVIKDENILKVLGCDIHFFRSYIESKFLSGMSWGNHGLMGWHFDHIIPLKNAKTIEDVEKLFHYTNTQPLWCKDNWKKSTT